MMNEIEGQRNMGFKDKRKRDLQRGQKRKYKKMQLQDLRQWKSGRIKN